MRARIAQGAKKPMAYERVLDLFIFFITEVEQADPTTLTTISSLGLPGSKDKLCLLFAVDPTRATNVVKFFLFCHVEHPST